MAFVGSSNLSRTALERGVEWNLRVISSEDEAGFEAIARRFEELLRRPGTRRLSRAFIGTYEARAPIPAHPEPRATPPAPHELQAEALRALEKTRENGNRAGLVVMATGLGKIRTLPDQLPDLGRRHAVAGAAGASRV